MSLPATLPEATAPRAPSSQDKLLALLQRKYPEYHPVVAMADLAHDMRGEGGDPSLEFQCHKEIAKYVVQVDKHVQIDTNIKSSHRVTVELFGNGDDAPREQALDVSSREVTELPGASVQDAMMAAVGRTAAELTEYSDDPAR